MSLFQLLAFLSVWTITIISVELVQVSVEQGRLEGEVLQSLLGNNYNSFKGIPYAAAPTGCLRFKAPQQPLSWSEVRPAKSFGSSCPQKDIITNEILPGNEDCLFLNVYSPNLNPNKLYPVMFFIHGGGFQSGSGNDSSYGPSYLMDYGVAVVTINYRLDALGFLSLGTREVPGNAGLKDQVAALIWVQKNIAKFGGDPDNVTIFGQSAGGASVAFHTLSPMSKGLFKRAISMSGVPFCDFVVSNEPRRRAFVLGKQLGINTNDTSTLLNYLQNVPSDKLFNTNSTVLTSEEIITNKIKKYNFVPVVEKNFGNHRGFLTDHPANIIKKGNLNEADIIIGYTNQEILSFVDTVISEFLPTYERYPEMLVPTKMLVKLGPPINLKISDMVRNHYFNNKTIDIKVLEQFINYASNSSIAYDCLRYINILPDMPNKSKYFYKFSMLSNRNYYGNQGLKYGISGAGHMDDFLYLFEAKGLNITLTVNSTEYRLVDIMCTLFTNFATYGNPTPDLSLNVTWSQYNNTDQHYLEIGNELQPKRNPDAYSLTFWRSVFDFAGFCF